MVNKRISRIIKWLFLFNLYLGISYSYAVTRYWIGGASTAWNNNANWGTASGSGAPASYPVAGDIAVFDGGGLNNCTLTSGISVASISITSAYTQTFSQGSFAINISGASFWAGGTFIGGTGNISFGGAFILIGTNFTSTSGTLTSSGTFSFSSGTFNHNSGTVLMGTNSFSVTGSPTFNNLSTVPNYNSLTFNNSLTIAGNLTLSAQGAWTNINIGSGQSITVNGNLFIAGDNQVSINTGTIIANGNISSSNTSFYTGGSSTIKISGSGNQTLTGSGVFNQGNFPSIIINKPSGTLNLSGYITVAGPIWNLISGTLAAGTSTLCFFNTGVPYTISGNQTLNTVVFYGNYSTYTVNNLLIANDVTLDATARCDVAVTNTMTVNGTLLLTGGGYYKLNTGSVFIKGNVINNNTNTSSGGGSANFILNGTGSQTITGTPLINQGPFPPFIINKPSGVLSLAGYITLYNGFTWLSGTVDPGTSTCVFNNISALGSQSVSANASNMNFYNIIFDQPDYLWTNLLTDISVLGSMTITSGSGIQTNNNTIYLGGNFTCLNTTASGSSFVFKGSTGCSMVLNGVTSQTITSNNPTGSNNRTLFYNLTFNNTASRITFDDVVLGDIVTVSNSATFTNGKILSTSTKYFSLKDAASCNIGNASCYINGIMRYEMAFNGTRSLNFPIGESGNWRYVTLNLNHSGNTSYTYVGQVIGNSAVALGYTLPSTITHVSYQRYTQIDRLLTSSGASSNAGLSGNQNITMYYDANDVVTDYTNLTIAKTTGTGSPWIDIGGIASANTTGTVTSTSSPSAFTTFSKFSLANKTGGVNPLPIELLDFNAELCQTNVCLSWSTASESSNSHFTIEKSTDGLNYLEIGEVKGAGNSVSTQHYSMLDKSPYSGISYYRLKQTDLNGEFKYFKTLSVVRTSADPEILVFPNPTNTGKFFIENKPKWNASLLVYNCLGEKVLSQVMSPNSSEIDLSRFNAGVYTLIIENTPFTTKLVITK